MNQYTSSASGYNMYLIAPFYAKVRRVNAKNISAMLSAIAHNTETALLHYISAHDGWAVTDPLQQGARYCICCCNTAVLLLIAYCMRSVTVQLCAIVLKSDTCIVFRSLGDTNLYLLWLFTTAMHSDMHLSCSILYTTSPMLWPSFSRKICTISTVQNK